MDGKTRKRLEAKGWTVGNYATILGTPPDEENDIDTRLNLFRAVARARKARGWTQARLAEAMGTGQPRVALMENGDPSTSTDLLLRALYALGLSRREVGDVVAQDFVEVDERGDVRDEYAVRAEPPPVAAPRIVKRRPTCRRTNGDIAAKRSGRVRSKAAKSTARKHTARRTRT